MRLLAHILCYLNQYIFIYLNFLKYQSIFFNLENTDLARSLEKDNNRVNSESFWNRPIEIVICISHTII